MMGLDQVGKYKILGQIGQGAMGEVYRAHDPFLNRLVALKAVSPDLGQDPQFRRRFEREAQAAAQLNHPNIITVYDFGEDAGIAYMAMELLEGRDLREVFAAGQPRSLTEKIDLILQICDGVGFAHGKGIVHRDLKPGNIHIRPDGQAKILDFGLARVDASDMTKTGTVLGTPYYMSPEQVRGQKADARSDVFSIGSIFYEALTGRRPFAAESSHRIYERILADEPTPIRDLAPNTPDLVAAVVERALSKDPAGRFADAGAMAATLRQVRQSLPSGAPTGVSSASRGSADETILDESATLTQIPPPKGPEVAGSAALAPDPMGQAETLVSTARPSRTVVRGEVEELPARPLWPWAVAGVLVLVLAGVTWMVFRRAPTVEAPEAAGEQVGTLTEALVASQIELAREDLANREYEQAVDRAQQALDMWPENAEAQDLVDQARRTLEERDAAVQEARAAWFDDGDADRAAEALGRVLSLDPRHPVVEELSNALDERFRQQAEGARGEVQGARAAAQREGASSLDAFSAARGLEREATALLAQEQYTASIQKFVEARDAFRGAARAARTARATPSPTAIPATPAPTPVARVAAPPPRAATPPPTAPPRPAPALPSTRAAVATPAPKPTPAATAPATPAPDPTVGVRRAIERFRQALVSRDMALYREVMPELSSDQEKKLRDYLQSLKSYDVAIQILAVHLGANGTATAQITRQDTMNGRQGPRQNMTVELVGRGNDWSIRSMSLNR